jgi:hypothetical protein
VFVMRGTETHEERLCRLAVCFAKKFAARWRLGPGRYRELVGACWQGLARMPDHLDGPAIERAAYRGVVDYLRADSRGGWGANGRGRRRNFSPLEVLDGPPGASGYGDLEPAARPEADPDERLRGLWADTERERAGWTTRQREWLYLFVIEGRTMGEVAASAGVGQPYVSQVLGPLAPRGAFQAVANERKADRARAGRAACRHCRRPDSAYRRGLCCRCHRRPEVRSLYPPGVPAS